MRRHRLPGGRPAWWPGPGGPGGGSRRTSREPRRAGRRCRSRRPGTGRPAAPARAGMRRQQRWLGPGSLRGEIPARAARRGLRRPGSRARCHLVEEQLVMADLHAGRGRGGDRRGCGPFPGAAAGQLDPAQPAVPVLHPQRPAAPGALALVPVAVAERAAGPAPYLQHHSPGQAVGAAAGQVAGRVPGPAHLRAAAGSGRRGAWA